MAGGWDDERKAQDYLDRVGTLGPRRVGEFELLEALPQRVRSILDLGCGDGRLAALVRDEHPELERIVAVDKSPPMLGAARSVFGTDGRVSILEHDLNDSIATLGRFDAVVSGFAIHHVSNDRKRGLFAEVKEVLVPGGTFANLEVVQSATPERHAEFYRRIGRSEDDPEDVLAPVEPQLDWMREAGLGQVDCQWRWRGFALLVGIRGRVNNRPRSGGPRRLR